MKLIELICDINKVVCSIPTTTITVLHHLMYCAAIVVSEMCGFETKGPSTAAAHFPAWKVQLQGRVKKLHADLSQLHDLENNRLRSPWTVFRLYQRYHLDDFTDLNAVCEVIHQKI